MGKSDSDALNVIVPSDLQKADLLLPTLSHPIRYYMTELMLERERTAVDFQEIIGITEGAALQHLRVLKGRRRQSAAESPDFLLFFAIG